MDLFSHSETETSKQDRPLAERLRPQTFDEFLGQSGVVGSEQKRLLALLNKGQLSNFIVWGPPGTGKTTFAHLVAKQVDAEFISVSAVDTGAKRLREIGQQAKDRRIQFGRKTLVFVDEIHRLNKAQQDVLLPFAEVGDFYLIGATTENPSYELNSALLSRCQVLVFERLEPEDLQVLLRRASVDLGVSLADFLSTKAQSELCKMSGGDARRLLNLVEQLVRHFRAVDSDLEVQWPLSVEHLQTVLAAVPLYYDRAGDEHYNCISAFIKSIRGSDPDAALYYLARMLVGGEDPVFIARRLVILASEDVGNADPRALTLAVSGLQAVELVGMPEARISLAQVVTYLASAPKSNRSYVAIDQAMQVARDTGPLPVPKALRSAQTGLAKKLGFGKDYKYSHEGAKGWVDQSFLPNELEGKIFYEPTDRGFEKNIRQYLEWMKS